LHFHYHENVDSSFAGSAEACFLLSWSGVTFWQLETPVFGSDRFLWSSASLFPSTIPTARS
jgi:hypothetical protein